MQVHEILKYQIRNPQLLSRLFLQSSVDYVFYALQLWIAILSIC